MKSYDHILNKLQLNSRLIIMQINRDWQNRHTKFGIREPDLTNDRLCKVIFTIDQNQHQINIYPQSDIKVLAKQFCEKMDVDLVDEIKELIVKRIRQLQKNEKKDLQWKNNVKIVLDRAFMQENDHSENQSNNTIVQDQREQSFIQNVPEDIKATENKSQKTQYFLSNGNKRFIQTPTQKNTSLKKESSSKEKKLNLYNKALLMREFKQSKIKQQKKQRTIKQMQHCTFHPQITTTNLSYSPLRVFEKLYQQGMQSKKKKRIRIQTLQSQQQEKELNLPFKPQINQCSRQIVRMRNLSIESIEEDNDLDKYQYYRANSKKNLKRTQTQSTLERSKLQTFTFYPLASNGSRKAITKMPKIEKKVQQKQKYQIKENKRKVENKKLTKSNSQMYFKQNNLSIANEDNKTFRITGCLQRGNEKLMNQQTCKKAILIQPLENIELKKQRFIENQGQFQRQIDTQEKSKTISKQNRPFLQNQNHPEKQSVKERALYNKRKKLIFEQIFKYLTLKKPLQALDFAQQGNTFQEHFSEITSELLKKKQYLPDFIIKFLQPMAVQLQQLQISLTIDQFVWSLQKIYESLSTADKGVFIGWGLKLLPQSIH